MLIRIVVALYLGNGAESPPTLNDQLSYHALASHLLAGHGFGFDVGWYPFTPPDTPTAHWSFLYPLMLLPLYWAFGPNPLAVRLAQAVLGGALLPWMIYRLARQLFPGRQRLWLIACALAACYAYFVLYAAALMTETFYIILVLWSLESALRMDTKLRQSVDIPSKDSLLLGLSLGLGILMRQSLLPWVPTLFAWLVWRGRAPGHLAHTLRRTSLTGTVVFLCILPFTMRNWLVFDEFLLLNSNTGYAMYSAQHPMHGNRFEEYWAAPVPTELDGLNEAQLDRALLRRGLTFVLGEPWRYARLCLSRVRAFLEFWPTPGAPLLHNIGRVVSFGLYLPFMLHGLYLAIKYRRLDWHHGLVFLFVCFYSLLHILTWAMVRYRLPVDAVVMPFAALSVETISRDLRLRRSRRRLRSGRAGNMVA